MITFVNNFVLFLLVGASFLPHFFRIYSNAETVNVDTVEIEKSFVSDANRPKNSTERAEKLATVVSVNDKNYDSNNSNIDIRDEEDRHVWRVENPETSIVRSKINVLARLLKFHVDRIRDRTEQVELVFLVDASASVGLENFNSELNFVKKLLSDFTVEPNATRVALVTFAGRKHIVRHIDQITRMSWPDDNKCRLLNNQLNNVTYTGGGTYTRGALFEALAILQGGRETSEKVVFLITDGFSNSGDPRPAAKHLKNIGATIFTFGIRTGNIDELREIASEPGLTHSYLLDSFSEFEALARRALHRDLKTGNYVPVAISGDCDRLCSSNNETEILEGCCDELATCSCGTATGHYACLCPRGYYGSGLNGYCRPCPNGTYDPGDRPIDSETQCTPCTNVNHITIKIPATSSDDCVCAPGFITDGENCEAIRCPKLRVPENGYFVKASACSNVVNAACGLRCRVGFNLIGDSIRLCRTDGMWSGIEPQCLLKTCAALRPPMHGRIRCEHEEDDEKVRAVNLTAYPIDTRCQFRCENGFQLLGSKVRNCLPVSRWDGLKVTCKQIKCEPLRRLANGYVSPETCTGSKKVPFGTNCTFSCQEGFVLVGPRIRHCQGKNGIWSQRRNVNQCIDKKAPVIVCPENSTWQTLPGKDYAVINWTIPVATDNSDNVPKVWSKPHLLLPWKAKIGDHKIVYVAQDASGNRAKCKFFVHVVDAEPPVIENCVDPPIFLSVAKNGKENVSWHEPIFHDNSGILVKVKKSHSTSECECPLGRTQIFYEATDSSNNTVKCVVNVTIEDACKHVPVLSNGRANCQSIEENAVKCVITCDSGFGFTNENSKNSLNHDVSMIITCGVNGTAWNVTYFPDCTAVEIPNSIGRDVNVILRGNASVCNNSSVVNQLSNEIADDLGSNMLDICGNDIDCNIVKYDPDCNEEIISDDSEISNVVLRRKRDSNGLATSNMVSSKVISKQKNRNRGKRKRGKVEIKFRFIGKIVGENGKNPKVGIQKLREKIEAATITGQSNLLNNKTNQEIERLALKMNTVFQDPREICELGRVLKKHNCTKCSMGTFHNVTRDQCQACYFGEYQNSTASSNCIKCPLHTYTKKMHSKKLSDCLPVCKPGFYSRRKHAQVSSAGLEPCTTCQIGYYQPDYGKTYCYVCPNNKTTTSRGSVSPNDCVNPSKAVDPCASMPCLNGGRCSSDNGAFNCDCPPNYVGSICDKFQNPCESSPCLNDGECLVASKNETGFPYSCACKSRFTGQNCQIYVDECTSSPCQNGGTCTSTEGDYGCQCKDGFEGYFCEVPVNYCEAWTCEEGSTCTMIDGTWKCLCKPGFLGLRCNLLPCDWIPCHSNAICLNVQEVNATRRSYRCVCPDGYEGEDCSIRINYCNDSPCLNDGQCINNLLNYTCDCPINFSGDNCQKELSSDFVLNFSDIGTSDYVIMTGPNKSLTELTACVWLQSVDTLNYGTVLSYATKFQDNMFTLTDYNGFVLYVNGEKVVTDITLNDGYWHFLCVDWRSFDGAWNAYADGILRDNGTRLASGSSINGNGTIVIGQEQDRLGGDFSASEAFLGKISYLDIWDKVLGNETVSVLRESCNNYSGSIFAWARTRLHIRGNVEILENVFCRGCPVPIAPTRGYINVSDDGREIMYTCEPGYSIRVANWLGTTYRRKCLKHGEWEGFHNPICTKVKCGHPGYFPRGRISGRSFMYGDEIFYRCEDGYELRGNPHRVCNADANWSGIQPICIGVTCKNLLAPENGDIEYIIEEHERDDISILQVGQQLEFKCDHGFRLFGERYLTCLETGKWDYSRPECVPSGCLPPNLGENAYILSTQLETLAAYKEINGTSTISSLDDGTLRSDNSSSIYSFGDVIGLSCREGYKFRGNSKLLTEFRVQCSSNGTWMGLVPDCVRLECPAPSYIENGRIFFIYENGTEREILMEKGRNETNLFTNQTEENFESDLEVFEKLALQTEELFTFDSDKKKLQFIPGTKIVVSCNEGYGNGKNVSRICLENENWSFDEPQCSRINCSMKNNSIINFFHTKVNSSNILNETFNGTFENLSFVMQGQFYKDAFILSCENGTEMKVKGMKGKTVKILKWICESDGIWRIEDRNFEDSDFLKYLPETKNICSSSPFCPPLQLPSNAFVVNEKDTEEKVHNYKVDEVVKLGCRGGYKIQGKSEAICLQNGTWSQLPTCVEIFCKNPPKLQNAVFNEASLKIKKFTPDTVITYQCVQGYQLFGPGKTKCLLNGKWSRIQGNCSKISCGKPKIAPGVTVQGRSYLYQEKLSYECPNGVIKGSITCNSDGKWSEPPHCDAHSITTSN